MRNKKHAGEVFAEYLGNVTQESSDTHAKLYVCAYLLREVHLGTFCTEVRQQFEKTAHKVCLIRTEWVRETLTALDEQCRLHKEHAVLTSAKYSSFAMQVGILCKKRSASIIELQVLMELAVNIKMHETKGILRTFRREGKRLGVSDEIWFVSHLQDIEGTTSEEFKGSADWSNAMA